MAWKLWGILLAVALGVAANLVTPYIKGFFRRGYIGMRKVRAELIQAQINNALFYNEHPEWLILYFLKELTQLLALLIVATLIAALLMRLDYIRPAVNLITNVLSYKLVGLLYVLLTYRRARYPSIYVPRAEKKIAKLMGENPAALERGNDESAANQHT